MNTGRNSLVAVLLFSVAMLGLVWDAAGSPTLEKSKEATALQKMGVRHNQERNTLKLLVEIETAKAMHLLKIRQEGARNSLYSDLIIKEEQNFYLLKVKQREERRELKEKFRK